MWQQGQHLLLIGSTGSGKTTLAQQILTQRSYVIALMTKSDTLKWVGWNQTRTAQKIKRDDSGISRWILRPTYDKLWSESTALFNMVWRQGGWTLYIDEGYFIEHELGMHNQLVKLLTQGRSKFITVVIGVQRPAWISRFALSEPTHIFSSKLNDKRDVKTMSDINGDEYAQFLSTLRRYQFGYLNREEMSMATVTRDNVAWELEK